MANCRLDTEALSSPANLSSPNQGSPASTLSSCLLNAVAKESYACCFNALWFLLDLARFDDAS